MQAMTVAQIWIDNGSQCDYGALADRLTGPLFVMGVLSRDVSTVVSSSRVTTEKSWPIRYDGITNA